MAPPQHSRVLRCCSCRLFQAHQVKKSLKWTCKACGEKQSFLRAYGEGSGADCRRHVQKLNLLQGQVSELSFRSLEEAVSASKEERAGCQQADDRSLQRKCQPSESRWLKYLDKGRPEPKLDGGGASVHPQPSRSAEQPGPPFSQALPRKRKWSQSPAQPPCDHDVQDSDDTEVTLEPQEGYTGVTGMLQRGSSRSPQSSASCHTRELNFPRWKLPSPAPQVKAPPSKWARFLLSPGSSSHVDTELLRPLRGPGPAEPAAAEQGTTGTRAPREGHPSRPASTVQFPQAMHTPTASPERPRRETAEQSQRAGTPQAEGGPVALRAQRAAPTQLCDLFTTGEDFDDDL